MLKSPISSFRRSFFSLPFTSPSLQQYNVSKIINTNAANVYQVISGVDKYDEFIPFVEKSFINSRSENDTPTEAGLRIGWQQFNEEFACKLICVPNKSVIAKSLTHSLFDTLDTKWILVPLSDKITKVELNLAYQFKNPVYNNLSSVFSKQVTNIMIKAFEDRILDIYSKQVLTN